MRAGFAKVDITPRVGVELCGFGPFLQRRSIGVRDRLWAKAAAVEHSGATCVLVSCDLIGLAQESVRRVKEMVGEETGIPPEAVMVHCTHTHSGPSTTTYHGWGESDLPYLEILPGRIADACIAAVRGLREAVVSYAETPCEGIGINREYERCVLPLDEVLRDDWRPAKPELTDTSCHVLAFRSTTPPSPPFVRGGMGLLGFMSYFGCHPVVCSEHNRHLHGDFPGVATNLLESEHPGSVGLFLQGAQGDVNACVVHQPEDDSLRALDIIAQRYARAVRRGLADAKPVDVDAMVCARRMVRFTRKDLTLDDLRRVLAEAETVLRAPGADPESAEVRMSTMRAVAVRELIAAMEAGGPIDRPVELQGIRIGPIALLGAPLEIFQAIKNDVVRQANSPVALVVGITNGDIGYAPDRTIAERGGYAADTVPLIVGELPFKDIHTELVTEMLQLEAEL